MRLKQCVSTLLIAFAVWSCDTATKDAEGNKQTQHLLLVLKTIDNPFFVDIQRGFTAGSQNRTITIRAGSKESDVQGQRTQLRAWQPGGNNKTVDGVALTPSSSEDALIPEIKRFRDAGIPVVLIDTLIPKGLLESRGTDYNLGLRSDNGKGGALAADALVARLRPTSRVISVLILEGVPGSDTAMHRRVGFEQRLSELGKEKNLRIAMTRRTANWRRDEARRLTAALLGRRNQPDAIFAANDEMALGAVQSYLSIGRSPPPIVGFDAIPEAISAIKSGRMSATIGQDPEKMGRLAAEAFSRGDIQKRRFELIEVPVRTCDPTCH
jgi:ribose transport system substrate-binding protein